MATGTRIPATSVLKVNVFKRYKIVVLRTLATGSGSDDEYVGRGSTNASVTATAPTGDVGTGLSQVFAAWFETSATAGTGTARSSALILNKVGTGASQDDEGGAVGIKTSDTTTAGYLFAIGRV